MNKGDVFEGSRIMAAILDEAAGYIVWENGRQWIDNSLSCAHGGGRFFNILDENLQFQDKNIELLSLLYACLAFGFQGSYPHEWRLDPKLSEYRQSLFELISPKRSFNTTSQTLR